MFLRKAGSALPEPGTDVRLRLEGDPAHRTLEARVLQSDTRRHALVIRSPSWQGNTVAAPIGTRVAIAWWVREGEHVAVARIVSVAGETIPKWVLRAEGPAHVAQNRDFVRVDMVGRITLDAIGMVADATMLDLSEGGMRCTVKPHQRLNKGQTVETTLSLGNEQVPVKAEIMRATDRHDPPRIELGLRFVDMSERSNDAIRRYVFEVLREQRRHHA